MTTPCVLTAEAVQAAAATMTCAPFYLRNQRPPDLRLLKATALVLDGHVDTDAHATIFRVTSATSAHVYVVNGPCTCPAATHATPWCKHRIAVELFKRTRQRLQPDAAESEQPMTHALVPTSMPEQDASSTLASCSSLPSIAALRQHMTWMAEFRQLLGEYVKQHMDPKRHMYTFTNNAYARIERREHIGLMMAKGQKPALNQDGIHALMALYEADIDDQQIEELREDGHYTCRVTLWCRYFGGRRVVGYGSCTTRESKYAYRWVYDNQIPRGMDKAALKSKTFEPQGKRAYTKYRLDNDDMADLEATVLQMALKRAKSSAVKSFPGVSDLFAIVGDPDEGPHREDDVRQDLLTPIGAWLRTLTPASVRASAMQAVFGAPLTPAEVQRLDEDRLAIALHVITMATTAHVNWASETLAQDLALAQLTSANQAMADLGYDAVAPESQPPTSAPGATPRPRRHGVAWDILAAHQDDARLPQAMTQLIHATLSSLAPGDDGAAHTLAEAILSTLDAREG